MKKIFGFLLCAFLCTGSYAQTLFTYGNDSVSVQEFLRAYHKNNNNATAKSLTVKEYLDLYIASKLKVHEAEKRGYDTLPEMVADLQNLRAQIAPAYLMDEEGMNRLVDEAFNRSQKDISLSHIFISFSSEGTSDSTGTWKKATEAYRRLQQGEDFASVARSVSDDPSVRENGGRIGYITVFSLPYELENLAYHTAPGQLSPLYASKRGYHIFKNEGERKALGRMKAAQILLAFPPDMPEVERAGLKKRADSLHTLLQKGQTFAQLVPQFSHDLFSAATEGLMQEFGVGDYDSVFENRVYALQKDGELSEPFRTKHGWHIVKRLSLTTPAPVKDDRISRLLQDKIQDNERMNTIRISQSKRINQLVGAQKLSFDTSALWRFSDSIFQGIPTSNKSKLQRTTPVLKTGNKTHDVSEWITYAQNNRFMPDGSGLKTYDHMWNEFVDWAAYEYYRENLEQYNAAFKSQLEEFRDGNLFFEIMQKDIWGPAQNDTLALRRYYEANVSKYNWKKSADAVLFYATDLETAKLLHTQLLKEPATWKEKSAALGEKVAADSGRFELAQIPNGSKKTPKKGTITTPLVNETDHTASFAYVIRIYSKPQPRSFDEARGLVINDYQEDLEKKWVTDLRKKYPVQVNRQVLESIAKK